jgi:glutamine cyclotransferase
MLHIRFIKLLFSSSFIAFASIILLPACKRHDKTAADTQQPTDILQNKTSLQIGTPPTKGSYYRIGDLINLKVAGIDSSAKPDSVQVWVNNKLVAHLKGPDFSYQWNTSGLGVGAQQLSTHTFLNGNIESDSRSLSFVSDAAPLRETYRITNSYPHNPESFTEGLLYYNGYLYEGTGMNNTSYIMKVKLETGKAVQKQTIDGAYFGEGISIFNNKLVELTWQSHKGFVYDLGSFKKLQEFSFPTEGWGMTTDGKKLIMSDGTSTLYYLDPNTYQNVGKLEVFDDKGPVSKLNELEYIDGQIYANVWETDEILRIDAVSGKVLAVIDMSGLLGSYANEKVDVLNGIAWDAQNKRLFVTGKYWPRIFQIEVLPGRRS